MQNNWSASCIKYLLFIFNLLFFITGIIILSLGVSIKTYYTEYDFFLDDKYFSTPNLLIATGSIIFIIAFFGCCGAIKESFWLTATFSILLILIFILEFAAGISGYVLRNQTTDFLLGKLNTTLYEYEPNNSTTSSSKFWDEIQRDFHCCGIYNYSDWFNVPQLKKSLPLSCCGPQIGSIGSMTCDPSAPTLYSAGCVDKFGQFVEDNAFTIASGGLALAFVQLLAIIFSCYLSKQIRKSYETV